MFQNLWEVASLYWKVRIVVSRESAARSLELSLAEIPGFSVPALLAAVVEHLFPGMLVVDADRYAPFPPIVGPLRLLVQRSC
jgi:hypothetical protein